MSPPSVATEVGRRLVLVAGIAAAAWLGWLTDLRPYVTVAPAATEPDTRPAPAAHGARSLLPAPVARPERPASIEVSGDAWRAFFASAEASFARNLPIAGWEHRIKAVDLARARKDNARGFRDSFRRLYFHADEPPLSALGDRVAPGGTYTLALAGGGARPLEIYVSPAHELVEFFDVNPQPERMVRPRRHLSLWVLGIALAVYVLVPKRKPRADQITYQRWRIVLGDLASALLFGVFFTLPLPIVGGSIEAATRAPILLAIMWLLAGFGLVALYWTAYMAVYALTPGAVGLDLETLRGRESILWSDVARVQPARLRAPRWLVVLSFLATFLGGSAAARMGQAGRALMIAGSAVDGMRFVLKDGSVRFLWVSDQMGGTAVERFGGLLDALDAHRVERDDTIHDVRAVFPPVRETPA